LKAIRVEELGPLEALRYVDRPDPTPGPGEALVRIGAAGVNFADTLILQGKYQEMPDLPFTPGLELAGEIVAFGPGAEDAAAALDLAVGTPVLGFVRSGAFAELAVVPLQDLYPLPDGVSMATAAAIGITYGTAHGALVWRARLAEGETLAVHGAAGGVGLAAVEIGKTLGARVIATAGGQEKVALAMEFGADAGIDYRAEDVKERLRALTDGKGADVIFDPVGGPVFDASLRAINWGGRLIVIGFASGTVPQAPANLLLVKNIDLIGFYWGSYRKKAPQLVRDQMAELTAWAAAGRIAPYVSNRVPLSQTAEAYRLLSGRKARGKVVLEPDA